MANATITTLQATPRTELGSGAVRRMRKQGMIPAVLYGHKLDTLALTVSLDEAMEKLTHGAHLVELQFEGKAERALVREIQHDLFTPNILHIDFARVAMDETVTVSVMLEYHGEPAGAAHGGITEQHLTEIEIECLPMQIPESIRVEVSQLEVGDVLHAKDVVLPEGLTLLTPPEEIIYGVHLSKAAAATEGEEGEAVAGEPEVIGEKEKEEE